MSFFIATNITAVVRSRDSFKVKLREQVLWPKSLNPQIHQYVNSLTPRHITTTRLSTYMYVYIFFRCTMVHLMTTYTGRLAVALCPLVSRYPVSAHPAQCPSYTPLYQTCHKTRPRQTCHMILIIHMSSYHLLFIMLQVRKLPDSYLATICVSVFRSDW